MLRRRSSSLTATARLVCMATTTAESIVACASICTLRSRAEKSVKRIAYFVLGEPHRSVQCGVRSPQYVLHPVSDETTPATNAYHRRARAGALPAAGSLWCAVADGPRPTASTARAGAALLEADGYGAR